MRSVEDMKAFLFIQSLDTKGLFWKVHYHAHKRKTERPHGTVAQINMKNGVQKGARPWFSKFLNRV
jgi:hypothetical protein